VEILRNERRKDTNVFDREVLLLCGTKEFCRATSEIQILREDHLRLVVENRVGLGQLFRYLHVLPDFELLNMGRLESGGLWRYYRLSAEEAGIICLIREEFVANLFQLFQDETSNGIV
jgi:hypothetical protein